MRGESHMDIPWL